MDKKEKENQTVRSASVKNSKTSNDLLSFTSDIFVDITNQVSSGNIADNYKYLVVAKASIPLLLTHNLNDTSVTVKFISIVLLWKLLNYHLGNYNTFLLILDVISPF